ncbi:MAG: hypothetical protein DRN20_01195 [Thermoplasmata archaeon]|nr:MAG: hypothetical protein DRN20_01195 [Thermoplasmata archaeon]
MESEKVRSIEVPEVVEAEVVSANGEKSVRESSSAKFLLAVDKNKRFIALLVIAVILIPLLMIKVSLPIVMDIEIYVEDDVGERAILVVGTVNTFPLSKSYTGPITLDVIFNGKTVCSLLLSANDGDINAKVSYSKFYSGNGLYIFKASAAKKECFFSFALNKTAHHIDLTVLGADDSRTLYIAFDLKDRPNGTSLAGEGVSGSGAIEIWNVTQNITNSSAEYGEGTATLILTSDFEVDGVNLTYEIGGESYCTKFKNGGYLVSIAYDDLFDDEKGNRTCLVKIRFTNYMPRDKDVIAEASNYADIVLGN